MALVRSVKLSISAERDHPLLVPYLQQLKSEGSTWICAQGICRRFCEWLADGPLRRQGITPVTVDLSRVDAAVIRTYLTDRLSRRAYHTARREYTSIRGWFHFLLRRKMLPADPTHDVPPLRNNFRQASWRIMSPEQVTAFLTAVVKHSRIPIRDLTVFGLLSGLGLRSCELLRMQVKDVDFAASQILVVGKSSKPRFVPIGSAVKQMLRNYVLALGPTIPDQPLWRYPGTRLLQGWSLRKRFHDYRKLANIPAGIGCIHGFRHFFITRQLLQGRHVELVAKFVGHSSPRELKPYFHISDELVRDRIRSAYGFHRETAVEGQHDGAHAEN